MSDADPPPLERPAWRSPGWIGLALILVVYTCLAYTSAGRKSVTVDELGHLPSGLYYLLTGDPRYASLNPPLLNALSALPVLAMDVEPAFEPPPAADDVQSFWDNGYHFHERQRRDYVRIYAVARVVPILVVAALAVLVCVWARRLAPTSPDLAGWLAAGLLCLSPNVIAQSRLVATDTGTAAFVTLALFMFRAMLLRPGLATAFAFGLALGLAQLTKLYALLLYPVAVVVAIVWARSRRDEPRLGRRIGLALVGAVVVSVIVLDLGYLGRSLGPSLASLAPQSAFLSALADSVLGSWPIPLPAAYLRALDGQLIEVAGEMPSYLFGQRFEGGRWYFYLGLLAVKAPVGLLVAFGLGLVLAVRSRGVPRDETVLLLAYPALLFVLLSASPGRQLGIRALLSATPLVWIWAASQIARTAPRHRGPAALGLVCLVATLGASVFVWPDYLAYFNVFAGGRDAGYRVASDANVDIGQDLVQLARHLESEGVDGPIQLLYFGSVDPALYGIDYRIPERRLEPGLLAVSVSLYHLRYPMYDHGSLRAIGPVDPSGLGSPVASIGGSIHVYRLGAGAD